MDTTNNTVNTTSAAEIKACCANIYQSDWTRLILGDSFHPGGLQLTEHLGAMIHLQPGQRVLDVASGPGTSAIALAQRYGCHVLGIDYSAEAVEKAARVVEQMGLSHLISFQQGDAERLPVPDNAFDAVICECAFCTFPDKQTAAAEFVRVLKAGGRLGLSDLTRTGEVPADLQGLLAWIACIADAQPIHEYARYLSQAGLILDQIELHDNALLELIRSIHGRLLSAELLLKLKKIDLPATLDFAEAKALAKSALAAIRANQFGYVALSATRTQRT
jgi:ubiquinone/menaquinone biosynthesis C-methylase UbiE